MPSTSLSLSDKTCASSDAKCNLKRYSKLNIHNIKKLTERKLLSGLPSYLKPKTKNMSQDAYDTDDTPNLRSKTFKMKNKNPCGCSS